MTLLYFFAGLTIIPLIIFGFIAQAHVHEIYRKYEKDPMKKGITGGRLARTMLNSYDLNNVIIEEVSGELGDHYDPKRKIIRLSRRVARNSSISSIGIAAHEASHAIQDNTDYTFVKLRNNIAPIIEKAAYLILPLFFIGILVGRVLFNSIFINLALLIYLGIVVFYFVTLPIELDASSRAIHFIKEKGIADEEELKGIKAVLRAAAFTYIIATALATVQF